MTVGDRLIVITDRDKAAAAFAKVYTYVSRQVRARDLDRRAKTLADPALRQCKDCGGDRGHGCYGPFTMKELVRQLQQAKLKKASGAEGISNEMLRHLGRSPAACSSA